MAANETRIKVDSAKKEFDESMPKKSDVKKSIE